MCSWPGWKHARRNNSAEVFQRYGEILLKTCAEHAASCSMEDKENPAASQICEGNGAAASNFELNLQ
jgi:hypothetical protein